jgi:hypothetical protein
MLQMLQGGLRQAGRRVKESKKDLEEKVKGGDAIDAILQEKMSLNNLDTTA